MSSLTAAAGGTSSWLLMARQEMMVLASLGCSLEMTRTLLTWLAVLTELLPCRTLGLELWCHPHPHGEPQHLGGQGLILEHIS